MADHLDRALDAIQKKDLHLLEDIWTEMILDKDVSLKDFLKIIDALKSEKDDERALLLLELLAGSYESNQQYELALDVYKKMLRVKKEDSEIRKRIVGLFKAQYKENEHIDEYLKYSGLTQDAPIIKALSKFEEFIKYDVGRYFYFERYGLGEVKDVNPAKREVIIDFEKKGKDFLSIDIANGLLIPINHNHFLYKRSKEPETLKRLADEDPIQLIKMLLKSFSEPLSATQIKNYLQGIVEKERLNRWWERVRKSLEKDENIRISGRGSKTYAYTESKMARVDELIEQFRCAKREEKVHLALEYAKQLPQFFKKIAPELIKLADEVYKQKPGFALSILLLFDELKQKVRFQCTIEQIIKENRLTELITEIVDFGHQKKLLELLDIYYPEEKYEILEDLFFKTGNTKLLNEISSQLKKRPEKFEEIYFTIFALPRQYPAQYQWFLRRIQSGELEKYLKPNIIPRILESLEYITGVRAITNKILTLEKFDQLLSQAQPDEAKHIAETVKKSSILSEHQKNDMLRIIEYHFPQFFEKEEEFIWTTKSALIKKKKELEHLLKVEIPENKKEISRAREFGDLSENFEYKAAKEKQDQLYQKVRIIEEQLRKARVLDPENINTECVSIGTQVSLKRLEDNKITVYTILGPWDSDIKKGIISYDAPVAKRLLGKVCEEEVEINKRHYKVIKITKWQPKKFS
ncbi:hypothetical protein BXT86_00440 [candidate division WOR-3 bacterium 4484_100]|uniref:Transcription elongation factor GreA n=1 Tax=candidate division WOR-3 bacterium 4484_100 TaxID=1936077 RepID=A0A1V4QGT6_UNCW3|nr:MAG: hypothetical protein BXT86_00440 [candidate division WOR-3 bacterium 4484_100]